MAACSDISCRDPGAFDATTRSMKLVLHTIVDFANGSREERSLFRLSDRNLGRVAFVLLRKAQ